MNNEEIRTTVEQIKAQVKAKPENKDKTDDEIDEIVLNGFLEALDKGEMSKEDLLGIMDLMGYEPTEEFEAATSGNATDATKEELEDTRTIDEGESVEDFKEDIQNIKEDEDEDAERKAASELFKMDLSKK